MHFDCVIAGAGPSASSAAIRLRQADFSVCLISPETRSQFTVGESLPGAALPMLNRIGIQSLDQLLKGAQISDCTGNCSAWGSEEWSRTDAIQNPQGGGWHLDRAAFDASLVNQAQIQGAEWIKNKITEAKYQETSWQLSLDSNPQNRPENWPQNNTQITCQYLIDATGRASALSKLLGIKKKHFAKQTAVVGWFESVPADKEQVTRIKSVANGWWYTARLPNKTLNNLPIRVIAKFTLPTDGKPLLESKSFIHQLNESSLLPVSFNPTQLLESLTLKDASVAKLLECCRDEHNFIAIGDAALSFDPLSSQGMFFALYSGIKGAEAIIQKQSNENGSLNDYQTAVDKVYQANKHSGKLYYSSEHRFFDQPFWQSRLL